MQYRSGCGSCRTKNGRGGLFRLPRPFFRNKTNPAPFRRCCKKARRDGGQPPAGESYSLRHEVFLFQRRILRRGSDPQSRSPDSHYEADSSTPSLHLLRSDPMANLRSTPCRRLEEVSCTQCRNVSEFHRIPSSPPLRETRGRFAGLDCRFRTKPARSNDILS